MITPAAIVIRNNGLHGTRFWNEFNRFWTIICDSVSTRYTRFHKNVNSWNVKFLILLRPEKITKAHSHYIWLMILKTYRKSFSSYSFEVSVLTESIISTYIIAIRFQSKSLITYSFYGLLQTDQISLLIQPPIRSVI